jgi:hypothetical protein
MSRAITFQEFDAFLDKVVQKICAIARVPFPKVDEIAPMPALDSILGWSNAVPTLDMMADIETFSPLAQEIPCDVETFMSMGFPVPSQKGHISRRPFVALSDNKMPELPMLNHVPAEKELGKKDLSAKDLENLLAFFKQSGMDIREVKLLPSGATRITFDEFFGAGQERQREFVRVGGR